MAWEQRGLTIPNGGHYVRWIYKTNAGTTAGLNAGFVDKVVYTPVAQFPSGNQSVSGIIGNYFAWQMTVVGVPATFAVVSGALPPGLALNPTTGEVYGTPTALGTYSPEIAVTNGGGTTSTFPSFSIYPNVSLATALDTSGITWNTGGTYPWYGDTSTNHDGVDAAHSGPLRPNQFSFVEATITGPGTISYYWKASTEANGDIVRFTIDGVLSASLSGEVDWTQRVASMGTGSHTLRWDFYRDSNGNGGQNMVWLDQIVFTPASATLPLITSNTTSSATTGVPYNYQIVSTNSPISYGAIYLPSGLEIDGTTGLISGTPLVSGSFSIIITATNGYGWDFKQLLLTVSPLPFAEGPDAPLYWSTYGNGGNVWFNQSVETQDGVDALRSGPITHNQTSNLQVAVYGPGTFNFWWKTDSEFDYDFLEFRVDGVFRSSISGQRGWAERSVSITGAGTHYLLWTYLKSSSGTVGQDAGWVDFATWTPAPQIPVITSGVLGNGNIGANYYSQITASNTPTSFTKVSGTVPPGLTLVTTGISAGTLSGYPTRPGTYNFQITAANAAGTSSSVSFSIFIKSSFENWLAANGLAGQNALATADPDFDGRNNLLEMALNTSPNTRELNYIPVKVDPVTKRLTATFTRITDFLDIQYEVQISDNLSSWTTIARSIDGGAMQNLGAFSVTDPGGANPTVIVVDNAAPPTKTKRSMRIKITQL